VNGFHVRLFFDADGGYRSVTLVIGFRQRSLGFMDRGGTTMLIEPEHERFSIVLLGDFNPRIFNSTWLEMNGLVAPEESKLVDTILVHQELTELQSPQFNMQIQRDRFQIQQLGPSDIQVFELTLKLFGDVLPHTPVRSTGLNRSLHFRLASHEAMNRLGDRLAPKVPWGKWGERLLTEPPQGAAADFRSASRTGGLRSITMEESIRDDGMAGFIRVTVEPSNVLFPGIYIAMNDHYEPRLDPVSLAARQMTSGLTLTLASHV